MQEIGELIGKGFAVWRNNLNLCIPFLLISFLSLLLLIPIVIALAFAVMPLMALNSTSMPQLQDQLLKGEEALSNLTPEIAMQIALLFILMVILISIVSAFFAAGAIGMARKALVEGKADTRSMWSAAKAYFWRMFQVSILMGFVLAIGLVFLLPAVSLEPFSASPSPQSMGLFGAGLILLVLYYLVTSIVLSLAPYALVVEGLGPVQAILASIKFFRYNRFDVLILWLVVAAISLGLQMIPGLFNPEKGGYQLLSIITGLVDILVLAPLSNLWWTMLYMDRKGIHMFEEVLDTW